MEEARGTRSDDSKLLCKKTSDQKTIKRKKRLVNDGCGQRDAAEAVFPALDGMFRIQKREDLKMALKRSPSFPNIVCFHSQLVLASSSTMRSADVDTHSPKSE